jgi:hypothetical protein
MSAGCSRRRGRSCGARRSGVGAEKWRNLDLDLPADFEANRAENYAQLRKPLDPRRFTGELREELDAEMSALNDALGGKGPRRPGGDRNDKRAGNATENELTGVSVRGSLYGRWRSRLSCTCGREGRPGSGQRSGSRRPAADLAAAACPWP